MAKATSAQLENQIQSMARTLRHIENSYTTSRMSLMTLSGALELLGSPTGHLLTYNDGFFLTSQSTGQFTVRASLSTSNEKPEKREELEALAETLTAHVGDVCAFRTNNHVIIPCFTATGEWACIASTEANGIPTGHLTVSTLLRAYCARFQALLWRETQTTDTSCGALHFHNGLRELTDALRVGSRNQGWTSLIRFELPEFKQLAAVHSPAGAAVVRRTLARTILRSTRASDRVFCCGPSGFGLVLPMTNRESASRVAYSVGQVINGLRVPFQNVELPVTCLVGVADSDQGPLDDRALLRRAQQALIPADCLEPAAAEEEVEPMPMVVSG
jgi:GGDEF domain-containing protein